MDTPTKTEIDSIILEVMAIRDGRILMTYVIRNHLARKFPGAVVETALIRDRLRALEKNGKVTRTHSCSTQICWKLTQHP